MQVTCRDVMGEECDHVVHGADRHALVEGILGHMGHAHPGLLGSDESEHVELHRRRLTRRIDDMIAGGAGDLPT